MRDLTIWYPLLQVVVGTLVVVAGWHVVHALNATRDRNNKRRDLRITYLIEAYRRLERAALSRMPDANRDNLESAVADIQLFGTARQVQLAQKLADEIAKQGGTDMLPLLQALRADLRQELGLEDAGEKLTILRLFKIQKAHQVRPAAVAEKLRELNKGR